MLMDKENSNVTRYSNNKRSDVKMSLKARGRAIPTAVDAAEITRRRFLKDLNISKVAIGTEELPAREGEKRSRMVSTMEITLTKA